MMLISDSLLRSLSISHARVAMVTTKEKSRRIKIPLIVGKLDLSIADLTHPVMEAKIRAMTE